MSGRCKPMPLADELNAALKQHADLPAVTVRLTRNSGVVGKEG